MPSRAIPRLLGAGALVAGAGLGYAAGYEVRAFTLRRVTVPVLPPDAAPVRVLHLSDLHLRPGQRGKQDWLRSLAALEPDLVIDTGDNLAHHDSVPVLLDSLGPLLTRPGAFVLGSNDYFAPTFRNPVRYVLPDDGRRNTHTPRLPYGELRRALTGAGWVDLTNTGSRLRVGGLDLALVGVDDPHLRYDDLAAGAGPGPADADLRVLHLSDVHMTPGQTRKQEWLRGLAGLRPDLVVDTGDNLAHRDA
ncbi:MAG: metallophosphoesterase, partial [Marmoricola sp.]